MDPSGEFFSALEQRRHEPLLEKVTGTVRFDLKQGETTDHFFVNINAGDVTVSDESGAADCVVYADRTMFNSIATGRSNAMAELLRGTLAFGGDAHLLTRFQRLFPGPSDSPDDDKSANSGRRRS